MTMRRGGAALGILSVSLALALSGAGGPSAQRAGLVDSNGRADAAAEAVRRVAERQRRQTFPRPPVTWWPAPGAAGLDPYGHVAADELASPATLILPNGKGSILTGRRSVRDDLPEPLRGGGNHFIVQVAASFVATHTGDQIRALAASRGAAVIDYVPNNAFLVKIPPASRRLFDDPAVFSFVTPYLAADKVHPATGRKPLLNPRRASSHLLELVVRVMPGEAAEELERAVTRLGGEVIQRHEVAGHRHLSVRLLDDRLIDLARHDAVMGVWEAPEYLPLNLVTSAQVEMGRFLDPRDFGDFRLPFREAGVDGGGIYGGAAIDFTVAGSTGSPIPFSSEAGSYAVMPQFLGVADNGLTLDAPSFSHDNANPCLGSGACIDSGSAGGLANVGTGHRKVEAYTEGDDFDATASGDFLTCDSIRSGGHTHGTVVAGGAAANPSGGPLGLGRSYEDVDAIDRFISFFNDSREAGLSLDGQARGARVIFQDIAVTPALSPPACATNFLSDVDAGDVPAARLADMVFRRDLDAAATTPHPRGARVTLFAFGNPVNFDENPSNGQGTYTNGAGTVDAFLFANRRVAHVQPVGNDGAHAISGGKIDPFDPNACDDVAYCASGLQINDLATGKNPVTVGANFTDSIDPARAGSVTDPTEEIAAFSSKGPATSGSMRGAPILVAPGVDLGGGRIGREGRSSDDYFISLAHVASFDNANDTLGASSVESFVTQGESGTSISAAKVAGAGLQIRDYFARGFYPTGAPVVSDRVGDMSGALVKALLINSADFASVGLVPSCAGRGPLMCPSEEGYGKVELANTLPLQGYRAERRPPGLTNVAPISNVPQGLLVADEYFDGGMRGSSPMDGSASGLGVVPVGGSVSFDFYRRHGRDQTRISLAWYDAEGDLLRNDLDLTVLSGDYELVGGGAGLCGYNGGATPSLCGHCTYAQNDDDPGYYDTSAQNPYVLLWRGNQFREFSGQFTRRAECVAPVDPGNPTGPGEGALHTDLNAYPQNAPDTRHNTESVMLHYLGDTAFFSGSRDGGDHGPYRARVAFRNTPSATPVPHAPCVAAGQDDTLVTSPTGDDTVLALAGGVEYVGAGADGLCETTAAGGDLQLIPTTPGMNFGQPFALAVAGPVFSARTGSVVSLSRDVYDCSERALTLRVADGSIPTTPAPGVAANTRVEAVDPNGTVRDTEGGFTMANDAGSAAFRVARAMHYNSSARRVQLITDRPGATDPIPHNGILEVADGWTIRAVYDDQTPTAAGGPLPDDAVTTARVICRPVLGPVLLASGESGARRSLVTGGCDVGREPGSRGDSHLDAGESVVWQAGFANNSPFTPITLTATLECVDTVAGGDDPCALLTIERPSADLGVIPPGREGIGAWTIRVADGVRLLATPDRVVELRVTFESRSTDFGQALASQSFTFREALQADTETLRYNTDFPAGGTTARDMNRDGRITTLPAGSQARNRELMTYRPLNDAGNPNLAISGMMPWRFDTSNGGFVPFRAAFSHPGPSPQNPLAWFYGTGGGCGWQTMQDNPGPSDPRGVWHAGHGPIGTSAGSCPPYVAPSDPATPPAREFIHDVLQSPVLTRVNQGLDARGMPFDLRLEGVGWNSEECLADDGAMISLEVDPDIEDGSAVVLGDTYAYKLPFSGSGPIIGQTGATFGAMGGDGQVGVAICGGGTTPFPAADTDAATAGFQGNTAIDPNTGLPILPGRCTAGICIEGGDAMIGTACATNAQCTGPATRIGHSTAWGPVRNREIDLPASFHDFAGAAGRRFQLELAWTLSEGAASGPGWTVDDIYTEWSERHAADQGDGSPNDCAAIPTRPGANPAARQCAALALERLSLHSCTTGLRISLVDDTTALTAGTQGCPPGEVPVNVRSSAEPLGELVCLAPSGSGRFEGTAHLSGLTNQPGVVFVRAAGAENLAVIASYRDPECDQDAGAQLGENRFDDIDGDGVLDLGADGVARDVSVTDFLAEGQGSSDDDLCHDHESMTDVYNPAGLAQRDNNGDGVVNSLDCVASPRTGQCDFDDDGLGDLCDNCPGVPNSSQMDADSDGIGDVCEPQDLDGDGVPNVTDNCPTLYNPSQAAQGQGTRGTVCNANGDVDGDQIGEVIDNCPNEGGTLENGVPAPPFSATYNPSQADSDLDGIGDVCDTDDFDRDGVADAADNCPTIYNPADPAFGHQADSDGDGLGDDRLGIDIIPGAQGYCDPDSDDDDNDGDPDDLLQTAAELECNYTQFGMGDPAGVPSPLAAIVLVSATLSDDGSSDYVCTAGDPDPNNAPFLPEPCPQETPASPDHDTFCDTPGQPGSGVCSSVPDGVADPGELAAVRLLLNNSSTDRLTGSPRTLISAVVGLRPTTPSIACMPRSQVFMGTIGGGATVLTPQDSLTFIVDPAPGGPGHSYAARLATAGFEVTLQADGVEGIAQTQSLQFTVDADRVDFAPIAPSCPQFPAMNGQGVLCEDFDTDRNGDGNFDWTRLPVSVTAGDPLRANGDPNDDILGFTMTGGPSPAGTGATSCARNGGAPAGTEGCEAPVEVENDWHLHSPFDGPGAGYDQTGIPGIGAPDGGKAHSGVRSMHMGRHLDASSTLGDTTRFRQVSAFVLDSQGDPAIPGVVIGPGTQLDFWHIVRLPDEGDACGFLGCQVIAFAGAQAQISLLRADGRFDKWEVLTPGFNGYGKLINSSISLCQFDPGDDSTPPADEAMCGLAPVWTHLGDVFGTDATCTTDTDLNDPMHRDCGDVKSCPIPGGGANCTAAGSVGAGVWARSAFDLSPFAGRVARLRWIGSVGGGWSFGLDRSLLEPVSDGHQVYQYYETDDGWWIDTIRLTDLRVAPSIITPDQVTGTAACRPQGDDDNCDVIDPVIAGTVAHPLPTDPDGRLLGQDALSQPVSLDARQSLASGGACENGVLQARWSELDAAGGIADVISDFSPALEVKVAPSRDTIYRVELRCSSDTACLAQRDVMVLVYTGDGGGIDLSVSGGATAALSWPQRPQPPGISGYDVFRVASGSDTGVDVFTGGTFDGICLTNGVPNVAPGGTVTSSDAAMPAAGTAFMYQVGHSAAAAGAIAPLGVAPQSSSRSGQLVMAGTSCP